MIAKHSWERDDRINCKDSKIIYNESNVGKRRVAEGALIGFCDTFKNKIAFTQEDKITNLIILKLIRININSFHITPTSKAFSLPPAQALDDVASLPNAGIDAAIGVSSAVKFKFKRLLTYKIYQMECISMLMHPLPSKTKINTISLIPEQLRKLFNYHFSYIIIQKKANHFRDACY